MEPIERRFVALNSPTADRSDVGYHPCPGIYHLRAGSKPKTAAIATHYNADFSEHYLGEYFAERGYGFPGWNTRFRGAEAYFMLEHALIGVGVRWLREVAGVENVVIIGNSGRGSSSHGRIPVPGCQAEPACAAGHAAIARLEERGLSDRLFTMQRAWADLRMLDGALDPSDRPVGVCYAGDPKSANYGRMGIGYANTCQTWLSMWSLEHSQCRGAPHLQRITLPALVVQSLADTGVFPSDARAIYENLASEDKRLEFIVRDHFLVGEPSFRPEVADLLVGWLEDRGA